ncbi:MAG: ATP-binding protein, partial [Nitriliruptoraceae bacterium]
MTAGALTPGPDGGPEATAARLAALHGLGLPGTARGPAFAHLVAVLRQLTGAPIVTLAVIDEEHAWYTAGVAPIAPTPLHAAPAADALTAGEVVRTRTVAGADLSEHPALGGVVGPVTVTTVQVAAPDGTPIGALELAWPHGVGRGMTRRVGRVPIGDAVLARFAEHVQELIELHAEVDEYRRSVELAPEPMVVLDADGAIVRVNPAMAAFVGRDGWELLGRDLLEMVAKHDRSRATTAITRTLISPGRTARLEVDLELADGRTVPCVLSAANLGGARRQLQLVVHDLSERLGIEEERTHLSEQLARAERLDAIGAVAAGLAHDLRNLLQVMTANLSLAEEGVAALTAAATREGASELAADPTSDLAGDLATDLAELREAVDRATEMTTQMLALGSRTSGATARADVVEVVYRVARLLGRGLPDGVRLSLDVPAGLPPVPIAAQDLERAVMNLLLNARDAVDGDGSIVLAARLGADGDSVEVVVTDDGVGMDRETQARADEPLFTTKGDRGTGMGLATVAAMITAASGDLRLRSTPGEGTEATLQLPVARDEAVAVPLGSDVPVAGHRVLLVDPGERTRRVIERMLAGAGYRVTGVASASEARAALDTGPYALMLTELSLPDGRGERLIDHVRAHSPDTACLALSSSAVAVDAEHVTVLTKPFSHARLLRAVA